MTSGTDGTHRKVGGTMKNTEADQISRGGEYPRMEVDSKMACFR